ncbi:hypothetical protein GGR67_003679 [Xanthomonas arboricola]|nr:hypothetical protein [Xanthomonas euroxanthea]
MTPHRRDVIATQVQLAEHQLLFGQHASMTAMQRIRLFRIPVLVALLAVSLAGCAAAGSITARPIEGPVRLGDIAAVDGPRVRPDRVIEDSRCPAEVQCVLAGRLIVRATVLGGGWSKQIDLTLGVPVAVADGQLTLVDATAPPADSATASASDMRFTFRFQGGR